jgi:hypothetical protein
MYFLTGVASAFRFFPIQLSEPLLQRILDIVVFCVIFFYSVEVMRWRWEYEPRPPVSDDTK